MKKTFLFTLLAACIGQLKAQTITIPNPSYQQPGNAILKYFKPDSSLLNFSGPSNAIQQNIIKQMPGNDAGKQYGLMPVLRLPAYDRMPVVKTDEPGMHYTMLIKGYDATNIDTVKSLKLNPGPFKIRP